MQSDSHSPPHWVNEPIRVPAFYLDTAIDRLRADIAGRGCCGDPCCTRDHDEPTDAEIEDTARA